MKYIYVAGPYTAGDPVENTHRAIIVGDELSAMGWAVYVPHTSLLWHLIRPHEVAFWYEHDIAWLLKCDALVRLPGVSTGADREVETARANGLLVLKWPDDLTSLRTLPKWEPEENYPDGPDD